MMNLLLPTVFALHVKLPWSLSVSGVSISLLIKDCVVAPVTVGNITLSVLLINGLFPICHLKLMVTDPSLSTAAARDTLQISEISVPA
jgi:hypothetical protein